MYIGSFKEVIPNVRAAEVVLYDHSGNPLDGFDASRPANATLSQPSVTTTSSVIAAANAARRQVIVYNLSNTEVYVAFAATATTAAFTALVPKGGSWKSDLNGYTGVVSAITVSGSATLAVTEVTT